MVKLIRSNVWYFLMRGSCCFGKSSRWNKFFDWTEQSVGQITLKFFRRKAEFFLIVDVDLLEKNRNRLSGYLDFLSSKDFSLELLDETGSNGKLKLISLQIFVVRLARKFNLILGPVFVPCYCFDNLTLSQLPTTRHYRVQSDEIECSTLGPNTELYER